VLTDSQLQLNNSPANVSVTSGVAIVAVFSGVNEQSFQANGSVSAFTLANSVSTVTAVTVNGILQSTANYVVSGSNPSTITFNSAPQPLSSILPPTIKIVNPNAQNQQGGVWEINIVDGIVNLSFIQEIALYQRVRVLNGKTYKGAILDYTAPKVAGQTVPYYEIYQIGATAILNPTTFNGGSTKFFTNRDHYYVPNSQDKYLKFPQIGAFN
jgi:hypothetical protein